MSWSELIYMGREYERLNSQKESLEKENKELKKAIKWLAEEYEENVGCCMEAIEFGQECEYSILVTKVLREEES
jgi:hypothetical protein